MPPEGPGYRLEEGSDFPSDSNAQTYLKRLAPHGTFVHADPMKPGRNVIIVKLYHSTPEEIEIFARYPEQLDHFIAHQDAAFDSFKAINLSAGRSGRFVMERYAVPLRELPEDCQHALRQAAALQSNRSRGNSTVLEEVRQRILARHPRARDDLQALNAAQRFSALCFERLSHFILPGHSPKRKGAIPYLNAELQKLVQKALGGTLQDGDLASLAGQAHTVVLEDHTLDHEFVQQQVQSCPPEVQTIAIGYGGIHTAFGHQPRPQEVSQVPLEQYLGDCRLFVFEPHGYQECSVIPPETAPAMLLPQSVTVETLQTAIQWEVNRLQKQTLGTGQVVVQ
ncbi:MAG TPA: hypothetical protein VJB10_01270 [Candidatus Peribacteraceae bacterium]|nr:hypothetical protein [Candidatus Peribacteraceae bacterium]